MNWLSATRKHRRPTVVPRLESLEDRTALSTLYLVPASAPYLDTSHFLDLSDALGAASNGDVIQIEPGATTESVSVNKSVSLRGDPAFGPGVFARFDVSVAADGVQLTNLNLGEVFFGADTKNCALRDSIVGTVQSIKGDSLNRALIGNSFTGPVTLRGNPTGTTADQILDNIFTGSATSRVLELAFNNGAVIRGNHLTRAGSNLTGIYIGASTGVTVADNDLRVGGSNKGIFASNIDGPVGVTFRNNTIGPLGPAFGLPDGISLAKASAGHALHAVLEGNDLHATRVGLYVQGDGSSAGLIDAGGGGSSLGGNNFRTFVPGALRAPIWLAFTNNAATLKAENNIWSIDPEAQGGAMLTDSSNGGTGVIDATPPLGANHAFVQTLYRDFLKRSATPAERTAWVSALASVGQFGVANAIVRSAEALGVRVEGLYLQYLHRPADASGKAGWVSFLQNGGTEEQVLAAFLSSPEFFSRAVPLLTNAGAPPGGPEANFVQSLYLTLLGRVASAGEVDGWAQTIPALGRAGVAAGFLSSSEFRFGQVKTFYLTLLHRETKPSSAEAAPWVNSNLDLISIQVHLAGSAEFFSNG